MVGCAAPNCSNRSEAGFRCFLFLRGIGNEERRKRWLINCRRDKWQPTKSLRLCEVHFEDSQFEQHRADGLKKLKPNAIPTVFNVPNCPKPLTIHRRALQRKEQGNSKPTKRSRLMAEMDVVPDGGEGTSCLETHLEEGSEPCERCNEKALEIRRLKRKIAKLEEQLQMATQNVGRFLDEDQIDALKKEPCSRGNTWSDDSIMRALRIRCATGVQGYNYLIQVGYPLPSYPTLCRRIFSIDFAPGIQYPVLEWMGLKSENMESKYRLCSLMLDEVQIGQAVEYDPGLKRIVGHISPEFQEQGQENTVASHVLCYMVKGITKKWKQVVAYFFTGVSVDAKVLWTVTRNIVCELGTRSYRVVTVVSDMASCNQGMWNHAGAKVDRNCLKPFVPHPYYPNELLHFIADVPHLLKNLRSAFLKYDIALPPSIVQKYRLPTQMVSSSFVKKLVKEQSNKELKIAPRLALKHVNPSKYETMRVNTAAQLMSHETASALRTLVAGGKMDAKAETTAFFLKLISNWFDNLNCRHMANGLFKGSNAKLSALLEMLYVVQTLEFFGPGWKPFQSGMKLSTTSLLSLHRHLVCLGNLDFLLTGRFTQDAIENLFSQVRGKGNQHPKPTQFRVFLKLICMAQFMATPTTSNYDSDDTPHLISCIRENASPNQLESIPDQGEENAMEVLSQAAEISFDICSGNALYYLAGWTIFKSLQGTNCEGCSRFFSAGTVSQSDCPEATLTLLRSYTRDHNLTTDSTTYHLVHPSQNVLTLFKELETTFKIMIKSLYNERSPIEKILERIGLQKFKFPECHQLKERIARRFLERRIHIHTKVVSRSLRKKQYAGKSAARSTIIS